jgi:hypothetical protein
MDWLQILFYGLLFLLMTYLQMNKGSSSSSEENVEEIKPEGTPVKKLRKKHKIKAEELPPIFFEKKVEPVVHSLHHYDEEVKAQPSRAKVMVNELRHRRDMVVYREIMDKPKSMR